MCNPTDNLVRYPLPYKVVDGCLCQETTKRNKPTTEKLCNFTAYIVNEVLFDDGVGTSRTMRIGGVHASGRKLPEIEITASEFKKMDWVLERWGADCIIEPVPRAAERICAAIQSTATFENTKDVYYKTGWKNIDGKWDYLLPGAGKYDVRLFGKLSRYEMAKDWSKSDLQTVWLMMKDKLIATKAIVWTLIALVFLTPLNEFLNQVLYMPKFVLYLIGRTGTRKSTLAALFLSFFGRFSGTDLPLSFSDTLNSILASIYTLKDVLTCIDDFHPGTRRGEQKDTDTAQGIDRAYGDRVGKGRLTKDCRLMESHPPEGNAIVTGETVPDVGESGTARTFILEVKRDDVNLENLSFFQKEAKNGTLMKCLLAYIKHLEDSYLHNEKAHTMLLENLSNSFEYHRDSFYNADIPTHSRVPEIVSWLMIGMEFFLDFMYVNEIIDKTEEELVIDEFREILYGLANRQSKTIEQDKPAVIFIQKLYSLIESEQAVVLDRTVFNDYRPANFIGYEDDEFYCLNSDLVHRAVYQLCKSQGESFTIKKNELIKALAYEGLLDSDKGKNVKSVNVCGKGSMKLLCIIKEKANKIAASAE